MDHESTTSLACTAAERLNLSERVVSRRVRVILFGTWLTKLEMMMLQQFSFCAITPSQIPSVFSQSLKQRNSHIHHQQFPLHCPRKAKASIFRISSLGAGFVDDIAQIAHNKVLIAAGVSLAIGQLFKPFTSVFLYGKEFDIKAIIQAGGFPSSHSSATVASATFLGLERGFSDPIFGLAVVYAGLIMYDAQVGYSPMVLFVKPFMQFTFLYVFTSRKRL
ncbi:hypothetical protein SESBI_30026 [Sesbania bispinosa]|nr:hypothetical protein SESBI_30026 [Sesbania bispinosa]